MKRATPENSNGRPRLVVRLSAAEAPKADIPAPDQPATASAPAITQAPLPQPGDGFTFAYLCERLPSFVQTFVYREIEEMHRIGMKPFVISIRRPEDCAETSVRMNAPIFYLPEYAEIRTKIDKDRELRRLPWKLHRAVPKYRGDGDAQRMFEAIYLGPILEKAGIRHVHAHFGGLATRTAWWLRKLFGTTYSYTGHANDIFVESGAPVTNATLARDAKFIVTETDFARHWMEEQHPAAKGRVHRIFNGIRMDDLPAATPAESIPRIISVGRYVEKKGFPDLIEACALLRKKGIPFECDIIGGGEMEAHLAEKIATLDLASSVRLLGPRSQNEVRERLATANVFALACQREKDGGSDNLPTVIMEAMSIGLPIVSTKIAGVPEMIDDGATGLLVKDRDPAALADALGKLITDPAHATKLGTEARKRARQRFDITNSALQLATLLVKHAPVDAPAALAEKHPTMHTTWLQRLTR